MKSLSLHTRLAGHFRHAVTHFLLLVCTHRFFLISRYIPTLNLSTLPLEFPSSGMDFDVSCDSPNQSLMMRHLGDDF